MPCDITGCRVPGVGYHAIFTGCHTPGVRCLVIERVMSDDLVGCSLIWRDGHVVGLFHVITRGAMQLYDTVHTYGCAGYNVHECDAM